MRWGRKIEPAILSIIYIDDTRRRYSGEHGGCEEEQNEEMAARFDALQDNLTRAPLTFLAGLDESGESCESRPAQPPAVPDWPIAARGRSSHHLYNPAQNHINSSITRF